MAVHVVDHPLVRHKLGILRKDSTSTSEFRSVSNEIARLLIYEATKGFATEKHTVQGWAGPVEVEAISGKMVTIVPILRAGLGLMDGVLDMIPGAKISVVGLYRNEETLEPVEYYAKLARNIESRLWLRAVPSSPPSTSSKNAAASISAASTWSARPKASPKSRKSILMWISTPLRWTRT